MTISWYLPIKTISEANKSEHWTAASKRHRSQQFFVRSLFRKHSGTTIPLPCKITMVRLGSRFLDDDNLRIAFKWVRDEISECILPQQVKTYKNKKGTTTTMKGRCDDSPLLLWEYAQEKSKIAGIRIEIEPVTAVPPPGTDHAETV